MNKLLAAGFTRLKKDKVFLILMSFMLLFGLGIAVWSVFKQKQTGYTIPIDKIFFICAGIIGMLSAIFSSLFIGSEYHDGAIKELHLPRKPHSQLGSFSYDELRLYGCSRCYRPSSHRWL